MQGRPNFIVPSFVATFATPRSPILSMSITAGTSVPVPLSDSTLAANLPSGPLLQQKFVVGPGFSPVPEKTVSQIVAGRYVDLGICCRSTLFRLSRSRKHSWTGS